MRGLEKHGHKWSEISKKLPGRCENSVKNRFNMLYKKHGMDKNGAAQSSVGDALNAVNEERKDNNEWIQKLIAEKQASIEPFVIQC